MLGSSVRLTALVFASVIIVHASAARAADAVVLSMGGSPSTEGSVSSEARAAIAAALEADGVTVVPEAEVAVRIAPARLRSLGSLADARAVAFELEARMVVVVALWVREEVVPEEVGSVAVSVLVGSRSFTATETVGEGGIAAASSAAVRAVRAQQTRAMMIEGSSSEVVSYPAAVASPDVDPEVDPDPAADGETPGFEVIGPTMLLAIGAGGIGLGIYALLDGTCNRRGASGDCLEGEDPNVPVGVALSITGVLALAGGVLWLVAGVNAVSMPPIDIVLGPDGGAVSARGRF